MQTPIERDASRTLIFVRHGATAPNLAGLRCGGDLDVALTDIGRQQAAQAAQRIRALRLRVGVIVASDLQRTRETATIISRLLEGVEVVIEPAFAERHLGAWNLRPIAESENELARGMTPPGGESALAFIDRISSGVEALLPRIAQQPLLVGSKGVARVLGNLLGQPGRPGLSNGELARFDLAAFSRCNTLEYTP